MFMQWCIRPYITPRASFAWRLCAGTMDLAQVLATRQHSIRPGRGSTQNGVGLFVVVISTRFAQSNVRGVLSYPMEGIAHYEKLRDLCWLVMKCILPSFLLPHSSCRVVPNAFAAVRVRAFRQCIFCYFRTPAVQQQQQQSC